MGELKQDAGGVDRSPNAPAASSMLTRRSFLTAASFVTAGMVFYPGEVSRHAIEIVQRTVHIANLPSAFHGLRIAQLSDIHYDNFSEPSFVRRSVEYINALAPDVVLLTGDFVSKGPEMYTLGESHAHLCAQMLKQITCPERYAIMGNHDVAVGKHKVTNALLESGIPVLSDSYYALERDGQRLWIVGLKDASVAGDLPDLDAAMPPALPHEPLLLMVHEPDYADILLNSAFGLRADLVLSGHSHGGQVCMPLLGPILLPPLGKKYVNGLFQFPQDNHTMQLYVSRGLGTVGLPLRLNCPPEVTLLTLSAEPKQA